MSKILSRSKDCPTWVLEKITYHDLVVRPVVIELPQDKTLHYLDVTGKFNEGVTPQFCQLIHTIRGTPPSGTLIRADAKLPDIGDDDEILVLMFIKHYQQSTASISVPTTEIGNDKIQKFVQELKPIDILNSGVIEWNIKTILLENNGMIH